MIVGTQVRAARGLLGWSQDDLAKATKLSKGTIRNLEGGAMSPRHATMSIIQQALEQSGIEFTGNEGVRRRYDEIRIYQGPNSCDEFFDDMLHAVNEQGGEVLCVLRSHEITTECCGITKTALGRFASISKITPVKCLVGESLESSLLSPSFQFRTILKQHAGPVSYFVYGRFYAVILAEDPPRFVIFSSLSATLEHRSHFFALWDMAPPVFSELKKKKGR